MNISKNCRSLFVLLLAFCSISGCGPSATDVLNEYRPKYETFSKDLKSMVESIPEGRVRDKKPEGKLEPAVVLEEKTGNIEVMSVEEALDSTDKVELDLHLDWNLSPSIHWMKRSSQDSDGDADFMRRTLQAAFSLKYLVLYRTSNFIAPNIVDGKRFTPGSITFEGFVFDLSTKEQIATLAFTATTPKSVSVNVSKDSSGSSEMTSSVRSALWTDARNKMGEKLKVLLNATVTLD